MSNKTIAPSRFSTRTRGLLMAAGLAAGAALGAPAMAEGLYVGGSLGVPNWHANSINGVSGDDGGTGAKIYGGYKFSPNFALEGNVVSLGHIDGDAGGKVTGRGYGVDAVGLLPINGDWTALARVGAANIKTRALGDHDDETVPKIGLGVQYALSKNLNLQGDWERYRIDAFGDKSNTDMFSMGVNFAF